MKYRCFVKTSSDYHKYGARGIKVCDKWLNFSDFYTDMAETYSPGLSIERIDNNKNYCKENCKWIRSEDQAKNRRTTVWIEGLCTKDFCKKNNLPYQKFLYMRNKLKMSSSDIINSLLNKV
jgi:hypothetical protein